MQRQDPLAIQIWRFFADTKQRLPEQDRMENLTWRMMYMSLRKRRQAEAARYGFTPYLFCLLNFERHLSYIKRVGEDTNR
jgi:hypothetical protein